MSVTGIRCSWCLATLEDGLNLDIVAMGWRVYQHHYQLCPECSFDVDRAAITIDTRIKQYAYSSYFADPGEVIFIADDHATIFIEKKFVREIPLKGLSSIFNDIENGRIHKATHDQHDEVRRYFGENCVATLAEKNMDAIRAVTNINFEAELKTKTLPIGREANIAAVRKMLGMVAAKQAPA